MLYQIETFQLPGFNPITVENFKIFKNRNSNWCYSFDTPDHKYLVRGSEGLEREDRFLSFDTIDTSLINLGGEDSEYPNGSISIWLIPENEEEVEEIEGVTYCILPKGWGYNVIVVTEEDFIPL